MFVPVLMETLLHKFNQKQKTTVKTKISQRLRRRGVLISKKQKAEEKKTGEFVPTGPETKNSAGEDQQKYA
jgi:hypothetical protein